MSDRMRGRPGEVSKITVRLGEQVLTLGVRGGAPVAEVCKEVRGVVLSRQQVQPGVWAEELARALVAHAEQNAEAAQALRRLVDQGALCGRVRPRRTRDSHGEQIAPMALPGGASGRRAGWSGVESRSNPAFPRT